MVPHEQENPVFHYTLATERQALLATKALRNVPQKAPGRLIAATWNLTNFGIQKRSDDDLALMAEIISWFDLVAIQEIADSLVHLRKMMGFLNSEYHIVLSDIGGNYERGGFIYDSSKVARLELAAEIAVPPSEHRYIRMKGVSGSFNGFDRNPYAVAFSAGTGASKIELTAVSVHLYFGSHSYYDEDRRALEAYALARWADQRHTSAGAYSQNILVLGDLNLPKRDDANNIFKALKAKGLILPQHSTSMGSSLKDDKEYDQVAFHTGVMQNVYVNSGVFDLDHTPFFANAWDVGPSYFNAALKYHIADHRPLWVEFTV